MTTSKTFYAGARTFEWLTPILGLPIDQINFLVCQFLALFLAIVYRKALSPRYVTIEVRHTVAFSAGIGLGYYCFGNQIVHLIGQSTVAYFIMQYGSPHWMHIVTLVLSLLYLSGMHLLRLTYDYGGYTLDITGPLMIATQKVTSLAFSLNDGLTKDSDALKVEQRRYAIRRKPTILEYYSYIFHFQALMCGPLSFYNDYIDFVEGKNFSKQVVHNGHMQKVTHALDHQSPSPTMVIIGKMICSLSFAVFLMFIVPMYPIDYVMSDQFLKKTPYYSQIAYLLIATSVVRSRYYHAWLLGESVCNAAGLGFNGYSKDGVARWDLLSNVDIVRFELSQNLKESLETWNKTTQVWLRMIAYDRAKTHKTLLTYILSAVWHGFYPGYYFTFLEGALFTLAGRTVRRSIRPLFQSSRHMAHFYDVLTCLGTRLIIMYIVFPFLLLEFNTTLTLYMNFYFIGHIICLACIFLVPIVVPPPLVAPKKGESASSNDFPHKEN